MEKDNKKTGFAIERAALDLRADGRFNPDMLVHAREANRLTQTSLARLVGVRQPAIGKIEAAISVPNQKLLEKLAVELSVCESFFFVGRSNRLSSMSDFYHRSLAKARRIDIKAVHARCSIFDIQIDRLLNIVEESEDNIPQIDPSNHQGKIDVVAAMARARMGVPSGPIKNLVDVIEQCGGIVIDTGIEADGVDALCRWVPGLPKLFFINGSKPADRIRFSLAHELGHTVMHFGKDVDITIAEEQANAFASSFLMPANDIKSDLRRRLSIQELAPLKRKWRVSMQSIIRRARDLGYMDNTRYTSLHKYFSRNGWRKSEPVLIAGESPKIYRRLIALHIEAGYSLSELSQLLFIPESEVEQIINDSNLPTSEGDGVRLRLVR